MARMPKMARLAARRGLAIAAVVAVPLALAPAASAYDNHHWNSPDVRMGYYTQWSVYGAQFYVDNVVQSGAASHLNQIDYAFINVAPNTSKPGNPIECGSIDPWADYQMPFGGASGRPSVDGSADDWSGLQGNFKQLRELKAKFPNIKVVASLGGFTLSDWFSDAALTPASRQHLVQSCIDMLINGNIPGSGLPDGAAAGIFDGIDIDWEYPGAPGNHAVNSAGNPTFRAQDTQNFTALLQEFRTQLDTLSHKQHSEHYLLTAALSASPAKIALLQPKKISKLLDQVGIMGYDFHGPWEATGPTDFQSNLFDSPNSPQPANNQFSVDKAVDAFLAAGADRHKITIGVPFYGHGWTGVPDGGTHGLYQPATGPAAPFPGDPAAVPGTESWKDISALGYKPYRDPITGGYWVYDAASQTMWVADDPVQIAQKMQYVVKRDLGGAFYWSLDNDDTAATLGAAVDLGLGNH